MVLLSRQIRDIPHERCACITVLVCLFIYICDQVGNRRFPAHLYVIARSSEELLELSMKCAGARSDASDRPVVEIDEVHPELFHELLLYMYSNTCSLLEEGPCPTW